MIKTFTIDTDKWRLVPVEPSDEMLRKAIKIDLGKDCDEKGICINLYQVMLAAAPQPHPNHNWCAGCSPDNCSSCGAAPVAYIFKPNNELLWPHEVDQNVFASDQEDYDMLYTMAQLDRTAELEAALNVAKAALSKIEHLENDNGTIMSAGNCSSVATEAIAKINEVLKP